MPHFYAPATPAYLSTNFKVMWSTLRQQPQLRKVYDRNMATYRLLMRVGLMPRRPQYLLVRNPYDRLTSFFKNKLRRSVDDSPVWQKPQRVFFEVIGVVRGDSDAVIAQKMRNFTFEGFIESLPSVYHRNRHLHPQHWVAYAGPRSWGIEAELDRVFRLESAEDLRTMSALLGLDIGHRANSTAEVDAQTHWTPALKAIVQEIYRTDFERYGYAI